MCHFFRWTKKEGVPLGRKRVLIFPLIFQIGIFIFLLISLEWLGFSTKKYIGLLNKVILVEINWERLDGPLKMKFVGVLIFGLTNELRKREN